MRATTTQSLIRRVALALCAISLTLAAYLLFRAIDIHGSLAAARRDGGLIGPLLAILALVITVVVLVFRPERRTVRGLQWTSHAIALAFLLALTCVWYLVGSETRDDPAIGTLVTNQGGIDAALAPYLDEGGIPGDGQYLIPTGVYVQSLEFLSANNVQVTGYVWQTYPSTVPASVTRRMAAR